MIHSASKLAKKVQFLKCEDFADAVKFAKYLGFTTEAELKQFGPNKEDYVKMVKFYE